MDNPMEEFDFIGITHNAFDKLEYPLTVDGVLKTFSFPLYEMDK